MSSSHLSHLHGRRTDQPRHPSHTPFSWSRQNGTTASGASAAEPQRDLQRSGTDVIYRYTSNQAGSSAGGGVGRNLSPETINAYNLRWPDLKRYLERQFNLQDIRDLTAGRNLRGQLGGGNGEAIADNYFVNLPRPLTESEKRDIEALRIDSAKQQKRKAERRTKVESRPLDSDGE